MKLRCCGCMQLKTSRPICEHCGWDENQQNDPHQLPIGTVLENKYVVGRVLGQGGFGITYIGWDTMLDMPVAIKEYYPSGLVMRENTVSTQVTAYSGSTEQFQNSRDRFLREAKALGKFFKVPQIVHVFNFFLANNTAYIIMEYVEGITLRDYVMKKGKLSQEEALSLLLPIMKALQQVHEAGIIHRDISPDNIMLLPEGGVKLLDFGAVRNVSDATAGKDLTKSTAAILKQGYAPLEQYRSKGDLGPWTDVYALCATICFCLTGQTPPDAPERILGYEEIDFRKIASNSPGMQRILSHGMALKAEDRISSMATLYREFDFEATGRNSKEEAITRVKTEAKAERKCKEREAKIKTELEHRKPEHNPTSKSSNHKKWLLLPLLILAVFVGVFFTIQSPSNNPNTGDTRDLGSIPDNINGFSMNQIASMVFLSSQSGMPENAVDISLYQDQSVMAWITKANGSPRLNIAANGKIYAPEDCSELFANMTRLQYADLSNLDTQNVIQMKSMFQDCYSLIELDLSSWETSRVTNMACMFSGCKSLQSLSVSNWDTSNVKSMSNMFWDCDMLSDLTLEWNTSNVKSFVAFMKIDGTVNGNRWRDFFN